ncbi:MAG: hypothetical protein Q7R69_00580 [bacterium]|nr:hypothetical protein [bacterium]
MGLIIIFKRLNYIFLVVLTALLVFLALTFSANIGIVGSVVFAGALPASTKINILLNIPYGYISEFSSQSLVAILFSLLFGVNLAGFVYYVRLYRATAISAVAALGSGSIISAIVGVGCISCGSLVAAFLASLFGASSLSIILPFGGTEFSLVSILLLLISIMLLNQKIKQAYL